MESKNLMICRLIYLFVPYKSTSKAHFVIKPVTSPLYK